MTTLTIGREATCDLVLDAPTVSRLHASIELAQDGHLWVTDHQSRNGTWLQRNGAWLRTQRVSLCAGDLLRFGELETPLDKLTAVFGQRPGIRLRARRFSPGTGLAGGPSSVDWDDPAPQLNKPRRNPVTGKIEEDRTPGSN